MKETDNFRCWAEIDLSSIRHNAVTARERIGKEVTLLAVVKANGYGHGLARVAQCLADEAGIFGVANLEEANTCREVVPHPILILGPALPAERAEIVERGFIASVSSHEEAAEFSRHSRGQFAALNLVLDTGMGRMGIAERNAITEISAIAGLSGVEIHSVSTHLPSADDDAEFTREQLQRFAGVVQRLRSVDARPYRAHALLSAGVLGFSEHAHDIVRAGLMLYGIAPLADHQSVLKPAMTFKARIVLVRDLPAGATVSYGRTFTARSPRRVATLGVGYADGYPRALSNRGAEVLIRGTRCAVLGRVTMDLIMVDVTHLTGVVVGDEAVLFGRQGSDEILASELATRASTIAWEIFTGIGARVHRVYH
ncbi:MAG: alanine racemase [Chthoniobacterales bacterium]